MTAAHSALATYRQGLFAAFALPAWILGLSMMGVGALARDVGFPMTRAVLATLFVFAGPAQVVFFGLMGSGASLAAVAVGVTLTAIRLLPMTASLMPLLRHGAPSRLTLLAASHFVAVTTWVQAMREMPNLQPEARRPYYFGFCTGCLTGATLFTVAGYLLSGRVPVSIGAGLLFMTPAFFTLSLAAGARVRADWAAIALGFLLTPLFGVWAGPAPALFLAGVIGGTAAFALGRRSAAS